MIGFRKRVDVENVEAQAAKLTAATRKLDEALKAYQGAEEKFLEGTVQVIEATKKTGTFGAEEFKELCNSIRHYGNLRYLIIPFFLALQGAPLLALKDGTKLDIGFLKYGAMLIVLIILGVFYVLEHQLNAYLDQLVAYANKTYPTTFWGKPNVKRSTHAVTWSIRVLYIAISLASIVFLEYALVPRIENWPS